MAQKNTHWKLVESGKHHGHRVVEACPLRARTRHDLEALKANGQEARKFPRVVTIRNRPVSLTASKRLGKGILHSLEISGDQLLYVDVVRPKLNRLICRHAPIAIGCLNAVSDTLSKE